MKAFVVAVIATSTVLAAAAVGQATTQRLFTVKMQAAPALTGAACVRQLTLNEAPVLARQDCKNVDPRKWRHWRWAWYKLDVRYNGPVANYIFCVATGYAQSGRVQTPKPPWGVSLDGRQEEPIQGAHVKPGQALHVYYHLFKPPVGPVARYIAKCRVIPEPPS